MRTGVLSKSWPSQKLPVSSVLQPIEVCVDMTKTKRRRSIVPRGGCFSLAIWCVTACSGGPDGAIDGNAVRTIPEAAITLVSRDAPGEPPLGSIEYLVRGPDGRILAFDGLGQRIEVYDSLGWVHSIGQPGAGPGEFSSVVTGMVPLEQGVAVLDGGNGRVTVMDYSGSLIGDTPLNLTRDGLPMSAARSPSNQLLVQLRRPSQQEADSIWILWPPGERVAIGAVPRGEAVTMPAGRAAEYQIFAPEVLWTPAVEGLYVVGSHDDSISLVVGESREVIFAAPGLPPLVDSADVEAVREGYMEELRTLGVQEDQMPSFLATLDFAETRPLVNSIMTSDDGDLWIQRGGSPAEIAQESGMSQLQVILGSPLWDHRRPGGELVETLRFPWNFVPTQFGSDWVLGVSYDDLGRARVALASH